MHDLNHIGNFLKALHILTISNLRKANKAFINIQHERFSRPFAINKHNLIDMAYYTLKTLNKMNRTYLNLKYLMHFNDIIISISMPKRAMLYQLQKDISKMREEKALINLYYIELIGNVEARHPIAILLST